MSTEPLTLFAGTQEVARGGREDMIAAIKDLQSRRDSPALLVFDSITGEQVDIDLREATVAAPPAKEIPGRKRPGRPKLGVVSREVTLLPRHWEWLSAQPSGASATLRKLVDRARRDNAHSDGVRRSQEAAFRFMTALAGNEASFEEACRSLFAGDRQGFESHVTRWPKDIADFAKTLANDALRAENE